jgi:Inner membrane component of T3SS, cytoplasmic domain
MSDQAPSPAQAARSPLGKSAVQHASVGSAAAVSGGAAASTAPPYLHVLSGLHTGVESRLGGERVLIGNLEGECDVVLDTGYTSPHACLVRTSADSWTVMAVSGDVWVGEDHVGPQQTHPLIPGQAVTLGRVAFGVSTDPHFAWAGVKPPFNLVRLEADGPFPSAALLPARPDTRRKWQTVKFATGLGVACLVMAASGAYLTLVLKNEKPDSAAAERKLQADKQMIAALPSGKEVLLTPFPEAPGKVLVQGYVPTQAQVAELGAALKKAQTEAEFRVVPVDDLQRDVARHLEGLSADKLRYEVNGRFTATVASDDIHRFDKRARAVLQEVPALNGLDLAMSDLQAPDGAPVVVQYARSRERASDVVVSNLDQVIGRRPFVVRELRLGELPSVVLDDGVRYFNGGTLPDGSLITQIDAERMLTLRGNGIEREVSLRDAPRITPGTAPQKVLALTPAQLAVVSASTGNRRK